MNAVILPAGNNPMAEENKPPDDGGPPEQNKPADESPQESANGAAPAEEPAAAQQAVADDNKKWYVVKVQSGREESIKDAIERRVKIEGLGDYFGQIIIPVERVTEMRNGKRVVKERKRYPGYLM